MLTEKQKQLGWREGTVAEFLGLSDAEAQIVEIHIALADALKAARVNAKLSQQELAARLNTKQPAVARLEVGAGAGVTVDALLKALLIVGVPQSEIAALISGAAPESTPRAALLREPRHVRKTSKRVKVAT